MTFFQGHDISLGHAQILFEITSRSDKGARTHGPDMMSTDRRTDRMTPTL